MNNATLKPDKQIPVVPEIKSFGLYPPEGPVFRRLVKIAAAYGKVIDIIPLTERTHGDGEASVFLVEFESSVDAMVAARELNEVKCYPFGFNALMISMPRDDDEGSDGK
jgi:hypothetical protein